MQNKFKVGDRVRVINYGHPIWQNKTDQETERKFYKECGIPYKEPTVLSDDGKTQWLDISPELVGKESIVDGVSGSNRYALKGLSKSAWYSEEQLELIK